MSSSLVRPMNATPRPAKVSGAKGAVVDAMRKAVYHNNVDGLVTDADLLIAEIQKAGFKLVPNGQGK